MARVCLRSSMCNHQVCPVCYCRRCGRRVVDTDLGFASNNRRVNGSFHNNRGVKVNTTKKKKTFQVGNARYHYDNNTESSSSETPENTPGWHCTENRNERVCCKKKEGKQVKYTQKQLTRVNYYWFVPSLFLSLVPTIWELTLGTKLRTTMGISLPWTVEL